MDKDREEALVNVIAAEDTINDILAGFRYWMDVKVNSLELTTHDEMFIRWMERHLVDFDA